MSRTEHFGVFTPESRAESPYFYLPVDVPPGCAGLTVELEYDTSAGVLDLGCFGPNGFRGWSGGARRAYAISPSVATPGYLAGELEPGAWSVAFGLHRVAATGLAWRVDVTLGSIESRPDLSPRTEDALPPLPERPPQRNLPAESGFTWLAGDLHAHSDHSDGDRTIDELAALAVGQGLDFLAVTDHNTVSHHPLLRAAAARAGLTLIPGQELTTHRGHANAFGDIGWIDFRKRADDWVGEVSDRGGLLSINHPLASDTAWRQPLISRPPLAEIWHWTWLDRSWGGPMAWWLTWDPATIPIGGSDFHRPDQGRPLGQPTTWVLCENVDADLTHAAMGYGARERGAADSGAADCGAADCGAADCGAEDSGAGESGAVASGAAASCSPRDAILSGLAAGRTSISADRDGPVLLRLGDELLVIGAEGAILADLTGRRRLVRGPRASFPAPEEPGPQWLEDEHTAVLALCG